MLKILSIGNSFSQDAQRYLHGIARAEGVEMKCMNLYIGGCSLERHWENIQENKDAYNFEINGYSTGIFISAEEALKSDQWDFVTLQQVSSKSISWDTYSPYVKDICNFVHKTVPEAKLLVHQTWAYEDDSQRLKEELGYRQSREMFLDLKNAYEKMAKEMGGVPIIPSGQAFEYAKKLGIGKIHRDTFHAAYGAGRYLLGLVWYMTLTGNPVTAEFNDLDEPVTQNQRQILLKAAERACRLNQ